MRVPQVSERIKEVPAQALRGVFAGIGQVLLYADKLRNKTPASQHVPQARGPERSATAADPAPAEPAPGPATAPPAEQAPEARDLGKTGNVRLLNGAEAGTGGAAAPATGESAAPLPNYDELSIASLRARLRNLDVTQVSQLAEYEKAHAARADVIGMLERRIAKLEAEKRADEQGEADAEAEIEAQEEVGAEVEDEVGAEAEG